VDHVDADRQALFGEVERRDLGEAAQAGFRRAVGGDERRAGRSAIIEPMLTMAQGSPLASIAGIAARIP
jgi:hypothetical protein